MKDKTKELLLSGSSILSLIKIVNDIGWETIRESSIQRIFYLSKVLYSFVDEAPKTKFENYHFSTSLSGPYSELINRTISFLKSREIIKETEAEISFGTSFDSSYLILNDETEWLKIIVYILALYGEEKVYNFTINDPQYRNEIETNSPKEIDTSIENITLKVLRQFKKAFEETLENTSEIDKKEYLELYFEYIFSKIIKRED